MRRYMLTSAEFSDLADEHDEIRSDYSGRGMWGDECIAYTGPEPMLFAFDMARVIAGQQPGSDETSVEDVRQVLVDLDGPVTDQLGRGTVWYWPQVTVEVDLALIQGEG